MKVLIAVTHLLGVGHLARAAALGRAFARAGHEVVLISGGRHAPNVSLKGLKLLQLPAVHAKGTDFRTLYDASGVVATPELMAERQRLVCETVRNFRPDAAIIELFPFGRRQMAAEFTEMLVELELLGPETAVFCSVRDVLAPPSSDAKESQAFERLGRWFDRVLVHGDPAVLPLEASWPVRPALARRLAYTGYVRDQETATIAATAGLPAGEVLVSGGGSAASLPLMGAALGAARLQPGTRWRLLVGHGLPQAEFDALVAAQPANACVERARPDFDALLRRAACSISQAGYNTMLDLAAAGVPAVVVPFAAGHEVEQTIRAEKFAAMGMCEVVSEASLSAEALAEAVDRALMGRGNPASRSTPAPSISKIRTLPPGDGGNRLAMAGAERAVEIVCAEVAEKQAIAHEWQRVETALDALAAQGRSVPFWWRDDDAVRPTADLDSLLALARKFEVPLALAVIPEHATPELAERLKSEPAIEVLVHGIAHANNAHAPAKKQELTTASPQILAGLRAGKKRLADLFGAQALPILVPPWNRISGDLAARLPELGFSGLSTFGLEEKMPFVPALAICNTHLDPIDWKARGGLVRASAHIAGLADMLEKRLVDEPFATGAIGLLTHHLVHDPWISRFLESVLAKLAGHPAIRFQNARMCFGLT